MIKLKNTNRLIVLRLTEVEEGTHEVVARCCPQRGGCIVAFSWNPILNLPNENVFPHKAGGKGPASGGVFDEGSLGFRV